MTFYKTWTAEDERIVLEGMRNGLGAKAIAEQFGGRRTMNQVQHKVSHLRRFNADVPPPQIGPRGHRPERKQRRCLSCLEFFASAGPGNRICEPCKAEVASLSPLAFG